MLHLPIYSRRDAAMLPPRKALMAASFDEDKPALADAQGEPNAQGTGEGAGQPPAQKCWGGPLQLSHGAVFGKEGPRCPCQGAAEGRPPSGESSQGSSMQSARRAQPNGPGLHPPHASAYKSIQR